MSLLSQLPPFLWEKSPTDIAKIHSAPPISTQTDPSNPLPRINQCPKSKEALQGINRIKEDCKAQGLIIPCTTICNIPILPLRKTQGGVSRISEQLTVLFSLNTLLFVSPYITNIHSYRKQIFHHN